jgi:hypothetical protein
LFLIKEEEFDMKTLGIILLFVFGSFLYSCSGGYVSVSSEDPYFYDYGYYSPSFYGPTYPPYYRTQPYYRYPHHHDNWVDNRHQYHHHNPRYY